MLQLRHPVCLTNGGKLDEVQVSFRPTAAECSQGQRHPITHALSGDAHVAGWDARRRNRKNMAQSQTRVVGCHHRPRQAIDTNRWFVICSNVLGAVTAPPAVVDQSANRQAMGYGFPHGDRRRLGANLPHRSPRIDRLHAVIGGSLVVSKP